MTHSIGHVYQTTFRPIEQDRPAMLTVVVVYHEYGDITLDNFRHIAELMDRKLAKVINKAEKLCKVSPFSRMPVRIQPHPDTSTMFRASATYSVERQDLEELEGDFKEIVRINKYREEA